MADDKRSEAMRKAIEEADAAAAEKRSKKSDVDKKGISIGGKEINIPDMPKIDLSSVKIPGVTGDGGKGTGNIKDLGETAKRTASGIWGNRNGRLVCIGVAALLVIVILGNLVVGMLGTTQNVPVNFEITDSELSVYANSSYGSGYAWDAYVEIKNTGGENIYLTNMAFRVQTEKSEVVMTDENLTAFPAVLRPGEYGYIYNRFGSELVYEPNPADPIRKAYPQIADGTVGLELRMTADVNATASVPGDYGVEENSVKVENSLGGQMMSCNIVNNSDRQGSDLSVFFVTYVDDGDGDDGLKCSGISFVRVAKLSPHATTYIQMDPLNFVHSLRDQTVTSWKMYIY